MFINTGIDSGSLVSLKNTFGADSVTTAELIKVGNAKEVYYQKDAITTASFMSIQGTKGNFTVQNDIFQRYSPTQYTQTDITNNYVNNYTNGSLTSSSASSSSTSSVLFSTVNMINNAMANTNYTNGYLKNLKVSSYTSNLNNTDVGYYNNTTNITNNTTNNNTVNRTVNVGYYGWNYGRMGWGYW